MTIRSRASSRLRRWREDPVAFVREQCHAEPDGWQAEALSAFPGNRRLAMRACKGPGKSTVQAWLIWNFLLTRPFPKIAVASITGDNLRDNLWTELAKWQKRSPLLEREFQWTGARIFQRQHPETWWASARSWARQADVEQQADSMSGLHAD